MRQEKNKSKIFSKGFSLIELIVAMAIFVIIMLVITSVFVVMVKTRKEAREMQKNMESIRSAMEFMAKNIRMSSVDFYSNSENKIVVYNHSQGKCMHFYFDENQGNLYVKEVPVARTEMRCDDSSIPYGSEKKITDFSDIKPVEAVNFHYEQFGSSLASSLGKVTISIKMAGVQESAQTSVSLRNYSLIDESSLSDL